MVYSSGLSHVGTWGVNAAVQPDVPPLAISSAPPNLKTWMRGGLVARLAGPQWEFERNETVQRTGGRCEVVGLPDAVIAARWVVDDVGQRVRLDGFRTVRPEVLEAESMADDDAGDEPLPDFRVVMQKMHRWDAADVDRYASFVKVQRAQRLAAGGAYRLDLGEWAHLVEASDDGRLLEELSPLLAR